MLTIKELQSIFKSELYAKFFNKLQVEVMTQLRESFSDGHLGIQSFNLSVDEYNLYEMTSDKLMTILSTYHLHFFRCFAYQIKKNRDYPADMDNNHFYEGYPEGYQDELNEDSNIVECPWDGLQVLLNLVEFHLLKDNPDFLLTCLKKQMKVKDAKAYFEAFQRDYNATKLYCLCCEHRTLEEVEELCPVCCWEHDYYYIDKVMPSMFKMPNSEIAKIIDIPTATNNGITLRQGRENFAKFGACEIEMVECVRPPKEEEK